MARQVLPIVGAAIGAYFGGPSGAQLGYAIGSLVGNAVDPLVIKGPRIGDASVQTSAEGVYRPVIYGTAAVMGNVIERGNRKIKKKKTSSGKGGPVNEEERVYWTFAIRICEGPIVGVLRIWEDEKLVYDARPESEIIEETAEFANRCRIYLGDEDQLPDPDIEAYRGIGNTPAYRGTCYIVFPNYDLTDRRESIPNYRFEVSTTTTALSWNGEWDGPFSYPDTLQVGTSLYSQAHDVFVACTGDGRQVSSDGQSWEQYGDDVVLVAAENPYTHTIVFVTNDGLIQTSDDGGRTVSTRTSGCFIKPSSGIVWHEELGGFLGFSDARPILVSYFGDTFQQGEEIDLGTNPSFVYVPGEMVIVCGQDGVVYRSHDGLLGYDHVSTISPPSGVVAQLFYDSDHSVVFASCTNGRIYRSADYGDSWTLVVDAGNGIDFSSGFYNADLGIVYINGHGSNTNNVAKSTDGLTFTLDSSDAMNRWRTFSYARAHRSIVAVGSASSFVSLLDNIEGQVTLGSIVSQISLRADLGGDRVDVSELDDVVFGVTLAGDYSCAEAIKALAPVYFFDSPEYDDGTGYKIRHRKRGSDAVRTLSESDFVDVPDETVRADSLERPRVLHMAFQSPTVGYAAAKASPTRNSPDVKVVGEISVQVPVAFDSVDEAWKRADIMLKQTWVEVAGEEEFTITDRHIDLISSDIVGVFLRGQARRMRVTQEPIEPGKMALKLLPDRQSAYTSNITGLELPEPTPPPPSIVGPTVLAVLDIPALIDTNDRLLGYIGMSGQTEAWYGALAQLSTNDGVTWQDAASARSGTVMGTLVNDVTSASPHYTDQTNMVGVSLFSDDEIEALSDQQFLSEGGSFALEWFDGDIIRWEILQYRDVDQDSNGVWWLSHLARGRLNTDAVAHEPGARIVFLDSVFSYDAVSAWIGMDIEYRATSFGNSPEGSPVVTLPFTGQSQREWQVAHLFVARDADVVTATTVPRHRFGTEDRPVRSANWQAYRWVATDGTNSITQDTIAETTTFNVAGWASPITVSVSQVNRITGAGPSVSEQIA